MNLHEQRRAYGRGVLRDDLLAADPLTLLADWLRDAVRAPELEPTAMALATVAADGTPSNRYVLCKALDARGLQFFTGTESRKGGELAATGKAAAVFWWPVAERSARVVGAVTQLPRADVASYFASRPLGSRRSAWASRQSDPVQSRAALEASRAEIEGRFAEDEPTDPPDDWGGYLLAPLEIELWQGRDDRFHDRLAFRREAPGAPWSAARLQP